MLLYRCFSLSTHDLFFKKKTLTLALLFILKMLCLFMFWILKNIFSGFSFSLDVLYPVYQRGKESYQQNRSQKLKVALKLHCITCRACSISCIQQPFGVFLFLNIDYLFVCFWDSEELKDSKNSHTWLGFHFVRNTSFECLVFAQYFLKVIDSVFLLGKDMALI